jgi:hypothetical protein
LVVTAFEQAPQLLSPRFSSFSRHFRPLNHAPRPSSERHRSCSACHAHRITPAALCV